MTNIKSPYKKLIWQIPAFILLLIVMGNLLMLVLYRDVKFTGQIFLFASINSVLVGGVFAIAIGNMVKILDQKVPWLQFPLRRLIVQFVLTIVIMMIIIVVAIPVLGIIWNEQITSDVFLSQMFFMVKIAFSFLFVGALLSNAILFFKNWKEAAVQQEILKREQLALQYETLKSQVNPHFLFNNLNSLTSLISSNPEKAIQFVKKLSEVYRYVLDQKDHELVDLETELKFLESYIFLQKIRFENNLDVKIDVQAKNFKVIPLAVQMLVENAIKHNEISDRNPMQIRIFTTDNQFLVVENKLQKKTGTEGNGSGIQNISDRYKFFTDKQVEISISNEMFRISIPLLTA
jgi:sensor histidine kinase YesM